MLMVCTGVSTSTRCSSYRCCRCTYVTSQVYLVIWARSTCALTACEFDCC